MVEEIVAQEAMEVLVVEVMVTHGRLLQGLQPKLWLVSIEVPS